jgi:hypothetical protein
MDQYKLLRDNLMGLGTTQQITIYQGIVNKIDGIFCEVQIGETAIPDVRLRSSESEDAGELLLVPKIGTAVTVGSLSGDLTNLVVIAMDHVESIKATGSITINGGSLGGMVKIQELTNKLNALVQIFNNHTHPDKNIPTMTLASNFSAGDYEDDKIKH